MGCSSGKQIPAPLPPEKDSPVLTHTTGSANLADARDGEEGDEENDQEVTNQGRHVNGDGNPGLLRKTIDGKYEPPKPISRPPPHVSHSQQEFFRLLDQKIDQGKDYMTDEEETAR